MAIRGFLSLALCIAVVAAVPDTLGDICSWQAPRGGVVRDTWWLEGGMLSIVSPSTPNSPQGCGITTPQNGLLYKLNFTKSFNSQTHTLDILEPVNETLSGAAPVFMDGALITNDYEWYTLGGTAYPQISNTSRSTGMVWHGLYQHAELASQSPMGVDINYNPPTNVNIHVTRGSGVSIPSLLLSFYFSGLRTAGSSWINWNADPESDDPSKADTIVDTLLRVDTTSYHSAQWREYPLPPSVTPRAGASMVWIPVGSQGTLVIVGGATLLAGSAREFNESQRITNTNQMRTFVTQITLYDIENDRWYLQAISTDTQPPPFAQACAVVASAQDNSSHQIYVYGGYDANSDSEAFDEVWILSLPAFRWFRAAAGSTDHGRYAHVCAMPYPNQMIIAGGVTKSQGLLGGPALDVFDLNTLQWTGQYDPTIWAKYKVPSIVSSVIGGDENGSAHLQATNITSQLMDLFRTRYAGVTNIYYPYTPSPTFERTSTQPGWKIPVIASLVAVGVLAIIAAAAMWFCCWSPAARRKRMSRSQSSVSETHPHGFLSAWLKQNTHNSYPPIPPKSVMSEDVTEIGTETTSPRFEMPGFTFYKPHAQRPIDTYRPAEVDGESQLGHSRLYSQSTSPTTLTPGSPSSSELPASGIQDHTRSNYPLKDHHLYPHGYDGASAVSTPTRSSGRFANARGPVQSDNPAFAYELPENHSRADLSQSLRPPLAPRLGRSITDSTASISEPTDVDSRSHSAIDVPFVHTPPLDTPPILAGDGPSRPTTSGPPTALSNRPGHQRNQSSQTSIALTLSPTTPDNFNTGLLAVSPGEERRRSEHINNLPDRTIGIGPRRNVIAAIEEHGSEQGSSLEKPSRVLIHTQQEDRPHPRSPSQSPHRAESQPLIGEDNDGVNDITRVQKEVRRIESRELDELQQHKMSSPTEHNAISSFIAYQNDSNRLALNNSRNDESNIV